MQLPLTFGLNDLDDITEDILTYHISMFNDRDGMIDISSVVFDYYDGTVSNENIHLYLEVKGFDAPKNGDEHFTVFRIFRGVRNCPSELDNYEEIDTTELTTIIELNNLIHENMQARVEA